MVYQAIISCAANLLWWIQGENVAVDMVGDFEESDSELVLRGFNDCSKWQPGLQLWS